VTVVLPVRNEERRVAKAIESIVAQTLRDWQLVVVDDGSTDGTTSVLESLADDRIDVIRIAPSGVSHALNRGIAAASAPLIARQDADDVSLPTRLERQVAFLGARPEVAVVGSAWIEVDATGRSVRPRASFVAGRVDQALPRFNPLTHTTVMFRRNVVLTAGGYDEDMRFAQDYDLWLRLARMGEVIWNLDEPLAVRVMSGSNVAARHERAQVASELRARWRDVSERHAAQLPWRGQLLRLALRAPVYAAPIPLKRAVRRLGGKA
jgi:glycosyltransferase involved in cell wall biosynthesis